MVIIADKEYCDKCDKYMQYDSEGKCIKCKTLIYIKKKRNNSYNNLSPEDDKTVQGHLSEWSVGD